MPLDTRPGMACLGVCGAAQVIETTRAAGGGTLLHCQQGVSRSGALVVAYTMWQQRLGVDAALAYVRARRAVVSPNPGFLAQLLEWEQELAALGLLPSTTPAAKGAAPGVANCLLTRPLLSCSALCPTRSRDCCVSRVACMPQCACE